jgi:hypothetical protein
MQMILLLIKQMEECQLHANPKLPTNEKAIQSMAGSFDIASVCKFTRIT